MKEHTLNRRAVEQAFSETLETLPEQTPHTRVLAGIAVRMGDLLAGPDFNYAAFFKRCGFRSAHHTMRRNRIHDEIASAMREEGGTKRKCIFLADRITDLLPLKSLTAWVGLSEMGVGFQWYGATRDDRLSVVVTDDKQLVYAAIIGGERLKGDLPFDDLALPDEILSLLTQLSSS